MQKLKIALVRGKYLNQFEMQSYTPLKKEFDLVGFASKNPIHKNIGFPLKFLYSPLDLPNFPYKLPILNRLCLGDSMYLFGLEKALSGFDIVHVRETYFHFTRQALNAKKNGWVKKVICTCSETIPFNHEGIWRRKSFKKRAIREVDHFHCLTNKARDCLVKEGCNPAKITVIPYGVDLSKFKIKNEKLKTKIQNSKLINLLFVGRLTREKGIYDLIRVFVQLIKQIKNIKLTIIGKGTEEENIKNIIDSSTLLQRRIEIKSEKYTNMAKEYRKADIFILLSKPTRYWEEYFGMAVVEAMASGLPIIATKCGAIPEVLGDAGILIEPGDVKETLQALKTFIKNFSLRKKLGQQARKRAEKYFDCQKQARKIGGLYRQVLNPPPPRSQN